MARFFINCVAEEKQFSKFRRTQQESSTMLGHHKYQRYMYSRKHYFILQSFKLVSLHGLEFFYGVCQTTESINKLTDSVLKNSFNQLLLQLKFSFACNINDFPFGFSLATSWKVVNGIYKRKFTIFRMVNRKTGE